MQAVCQPPAQVKGQSQAKLQLDGLDALTGVDTKREGGAESCQSGSKSAKWVACQLLNIRQGEGVAAQHVDYMHVGFEPKSTTRRMGVSTRRHSEEHKEG